MHIMTPEEFNRIMTPMRARLKVAARGIAGDDDRAEDLVQEALLALWAMRSSLSRYESLMGLAVTVMRNKYCDSRRHAALERGRELPEAARAVAPYDMELHDDVALISAIVDRLPSLQRTVFRMKEIEGYDAADIMLVTGCTAEALRQNLSRARRKIRDEFMCITSRP